MHKPPTLVLEQELKHRKIALLCDYLINRHITFVSDSEWQKYSKNFTGSDADSDKYNDGY